ncbi:MAG TPA: hypothetical protein VHW09_26885 [Bryobacteraceae bacterium]|jgi:hypothetical protein|nr:hypothetical protein [Bryobacteraceae bacterium]
MSELRLFVPIGKVDAAKRLVYGTLTAETPDKSGEIFDYASGKPAVQAWSDEIKAATKGKSLGNVRAMHDKIAAGKFTDIVYDDENKRIEGAAKIIDDAEWEKVVEGVYTGFSIGGSYTKRWQDKDNPSLWRFTPELSEISLVDNPCVPTATFEYIKADGSREMRKFITHSHKEDSMDPKALAAAKEALAKGTATDEQKTLLAKETAELLRAAQEADAKGEATDDQKALVKAAADEAAKVVLVKDGKPVKPKTAPVQDNAWIAPTDGSRHATKREAEIHELHLEKQAELAPGLAQMDALLKGAKTPAEDEDEDAEGDDEDAKAKKKERREKKAKEKAEKDDAEMAAKAKEKEEADKAAADELAKKAKEQADAAATLGKKDYSDKERKEMADKGEAMAGGEFPIKTKKDVEDAVKDWGRAGSKPDVKAHIIARAKAIGAEDALPDGWIKKDKKEKATPTGKLEKGLHQVGWLARMLDELNQFKGCVAMEQYFEGDTDSELPAKLKSLVSEMCELLVTLVQEETEELTEGDDDDVEILEMAAGLPAGHPEAIAKAARAKAEPLVKSDSKKDSEFGAQLVKFAEALEKAGARHSKADAERVQALHDHAADVVKCFGAMAEKCTDMHKASGEAKNTAIDLGAKGDRYEGEDDTANKSAAKMSKLLDALQAERDNGAATAKVLTSTYERLEKAIPLIEGLQKQNAEFVSRIEHLESQPAAPKGNVRTISKAQDNGDAGGETEAEYQAKLAKMSPVEKSRELMKLAMANPQELQRL